ncbi:MAG: hypothetical protein AABX99_02940 [Nanoarchaeota archaeon]
MKKENIKLGEVYIQCPDHECKFWDYDNFHCEYDCPQREKLEKIMYCPNCDELIRLPINHSLLARIDHRCIEGRICAMFQSRIIITREDIE